MQSTAKFAGEQDCNGIFGWRLREHLRLVPPYSSARNAEEWGACDPSRRCTVANRSAADRRSVAEATMGTMKVVVVEPRGKLLVAFL